MKSKNLKFSIWWCSTVVATTRWFLWFARCKRNFQDDMESSVSLFYKIIKFSSNKKLLTKWDTPSTHKENNSEDFSHIICSDGSFLDKSQLAGIGWTINSNSILVAAGASPVKATSIIELEFLAAVVGLEEAKKMGLKKFLLHTDSVSLYLQLSGLLSIPNEINVLVSHCRNLLAEGEGVVQWTRRVFLSAPDSLAKLARSLAVSNF